MSVSIFSLASSIRNSTVLAAFYHQKYFGKSGPDSTYSCHTVPKSPPQALILATGASQESFAVGTQHAPVAKSSIDIGRAICYSVH
jgi:hypothetical protein